MPLISEHFKKNDKLQRCLVRDPDHVVPGSRGEHVGLIQSALIQLGAAVISPTEIAQQFYGPSTARAVLTFKGPPRNIINRAYQDAPDNIVGKMTIKQLDKEMEELERRPVSLLVAVTEAGAPHNHASCPSLQAGGHEGTPINPLGFGRMVNIFGEHETDYVGFRDFSTRPDWAAGRPLTYDPPERGGIKDKTASDICMRSSPVTDEDFTKATGMRNTIAEIKRMAFPGCRLTYAGSESNIASFGAKILRLGTLIETVLIKTPGHVEPLGTVVPPSVFTIYVISIL